MIPTEPLRHVKIDGVDFIPKDSVIPPRAMQLLNELYGILWSEGYYDPLTEEIGKFVRPLSDKMTELNDILRFKQ